jgi:hypothetical protein
VRDVAYLAKGRDGLKKIQLRIPNKLYFLAKPTRYADCGIVLKLN